jgi:hypothetical protein
MVAAPEETSIRAAPAPKVETSAAEDVAGWNRGRLGWSNGMVRCRSRRHTENFSNPEGENNPPG